MLRCLDAMSLSLSFTRLLCGGMGAEGAMSGDLTAGYPIWPGGDLTAGCPIWLSDLPPAAACCDCEMRCCLDAMSLSLSFTRLLCGGMGAEGAMSGDPTAGYPIWPRGDLTAGCPIWLSDLPPAAACCDCAMRCCPVAILCSVCSALALCCAAGTGAKGLL